MTDIRHDGSPASAVEHARSPRVEAAMRRLSKGEFSTYREAVEAAAEPPVSSEPAKSVLATDPLLPKVTELAPKQREALDRVPEVFGTVVPTERRLLSQQEVDLLIEERDTLDEAEKALKKRKDDIRLILLNHNDVEVEQELGEEDEWPATDKDGHYLRAASLPSSTSARRASLEPRAGRATIHTPDIEALAEGDDAVISREDYLAMTRQTRVFDEHRAMLHIKAHPELLEHLSGVMEEGTGSITVAFRNQ